MAERFEHHARTVSLLTLLSRITGLARDATLSRVFGAGPLMDAFFFAFLIPNLFRRLFGEGALSAALLPVYTKLESHDPEAARATASLLISRAALWLGAVTLVGEAVLLVISLVGEHANPAVWLMIIMLPYMPLVCLVALLGAMLQVHGRFGPTAAAPVILNLAIIGAAVAGVYLAVGERDADANADALIDGRLLHIGAVAGSVILAGVAQLLWSMRALRGTGWWTRKTDPGRPHARQVLATAGPMILGLGVLQLNTLFDGVIASYPTTVGQTIAGITYPLETGAMAAISFAQRLYQFPLGVFGIAIATAIFPLLARQADDASAFADSLRRGLRLAVFIGLPASVGLMLVREPLAMAVLQGGDFHADDARRVGFVLLGYAPAIWAYSLTHTLTRAFYAREDSKTPVRVAMSVVGLNLALNCTLIWTPLREAGLAWSTSICAAIQAATLIIIAHRRLGSLVDRAVVLSWARTVALSAVMGAGVAVAAWWMPKAEQWSTAIWQLAGLVILGSAIAALAAVSLGMAELRWALGTARRRKK